MWYLQAGIKRRLLAPSMGATTLYGEYQQFDDFGVRIDAAPITTVPQANLAVEDRPVGSEITDSSAEIWGLGIVQDIDVAAMKLYAAYRHYDFTARVAIPDSAAIGKGQNLPLQDFDAVAFGGRINF